MLCLGSDIVKNLIKAEDGVVNPLKSLIGSQSQTASSLNLSTEQIQQHSTVKSSR